MKTLILFLAAALLFVFSAGVTYGQASNKNKQVHTESFYTAGMLDCSDDPVSGHVNFTSTIWDNKMQLRVSAIFVGISGKIYEWVLVENIMAKNYVHGRSYHETTTINGSIYCEGQEIAILKVLYHITINPDGKMTANVEKGTLVWECL